MRGHVQGLTGAGRVVLGFRNRTHRLLPLLIRRPTTPFRRMIAAAAYQLMPTKGVGDELEPVFRPSIEASANHWLSSSGKLAPMRPVTIPKVQKAQCGWSAFRQYRPSGTWEAAIDLPRVYSILWSLERATPDGGAPQPRLARTKTARKDSKISFRGSSTASSASGNLYPRRRYHACFSWPRGGGGCIAECDILCLVAYVWSKSQAQPKEISPSEETSVRIKVVHGLARLESWGSSCTRVSHYSPSRHLGHANSLSTETRS